VSQDLYDVLGVGKDAPEPTIKKAYKRLARKYHPDLNKDDPKAEERFKQVTEAFEVLGNPDKRKLYDEFGPVVLKPGFDADRARQYARWQGAGGSPGSGSHPFGEDGQQVPFEDLFGSIFGGGFSQGRRRRTQVRGQDVEARIELDLMQALKGGKVDLTVQVPQPCPNCHGTGRTGQPRVCPACGGTGKRSLGKGMLNIQIPCDECAGTGQLSGPPCPRCGGTGSMLKRQKLKVKIPVGITDGDTIRLAGKGRPGHRGGENGDLYLHVHVRPHQWLRRDGDDLHMKLPITVSEAVVGASVEVPTLDGSVRVKIPRGSNNGQKLRLKGKGAPNRSGGKGDMFVELFIVLPPDAGEALEEAARSMERFYTSDVRQELSL